MVTVCFCDIFCLFILYDFIAGSPVKLALNDTFLNSQAKQICFQRTIRDFATCNYLNTLSKQTSTNDSLSKEEDETVRRAFRLNSESDRCIVY